jgi:hypothetical protein
MRGKNAGPGVIRKIHPLNFPKGTLFNRVNEVDPLACKECNGQMQITDSQATKHPLHHGLA